MKHAKGFTLIELIVVIAIIGALSAFLVSNFMNAREKARDTQRKSDLKQIKQSLELYRQDQANSAYPTGIPTSGNCWTSGGSSTSCLAGNVYMSKFPGDPTRKDAVSGNNAYYYRSTDNLSFTISTCLENSADPEGKTCPAPFATYSGGYNCVAPYKCYTLTQD